jgi:hypothetical protein
MLCAGFSPREAGVLCRPTAGARQGDPTEPFVRQINRRSVPVGAFPCHTDFGTYSTRGQPDS